MLRVLSFWVFLGRDDGPTVKLRKPFPMKIKSGLRLALALSLPFQVTAVALVFPAEVAAKTTPNTSLSRALGAVLVPVTAESIKKFKIKGATSGMMIVSMQPDGAAKSAGFLPGDVITKVQGMTITDNVTLDEIVFFALDEDVTDFVFDGWHAGKEVSLKVTLSVEGVGKPIDLTSVATWSFFEFDGFSYDDFYAEYSSELTESYEISETIVEDYSVAEEATEEMDAATDEGEADAAADETGDEADAEGGDEGGGDEGEGDAADEGGDEG